MNKILYGFSRLNVYGQFLATLAILCVSTLLIGVAEANDHTPFSFAINFGPLACTSAFFVLFFRVASAGK